MKLDQKTKGWINKKAKEENDTQLLIATSIYIKQLNEHINGLSYLSGTEIEAKLDTLIGYATFCFDLPINNLSLLRARRCESENCKSKNYKNVDELSYIQKPTTLFPSKGRLNQQGESLFYASIPLSNDDYALSVILSEVRARDLDDFNILRSEQISGKDLRIRLIGIWDDVRKGIKPTYLSKRVFDFYTEVWDMMKKDFSEELLLAFKLADRFLADIMSQKGHERLYDVTSLASKIILDDEGADEKVDGILYSSVQAKGAPVIALKPNAVDRVLQHKWVSQIHVKKNIGYEFYRYQILATTKNIQSDGTLIW